MTRGTGVGGNIAADEHVGSRIALRRTGMSMSQAALGAAVAVTFQQIQKYESGSNRVSESRLWMIARVLCVPVAWFFEGLDGEPVPEWSATEMRILRAVRRWDKAQQELFLAFIGGLHDR